MARLRLGLVHMQHGSHTKKEKKKESDLPELNQWPRDICAQVWTHTLGATVSRSTIWAKVGNSRVGGTKTQSGSGIRSTWMHVYDVVLRAWLIYCTHLSRPSIDTVRMYMFAIIELLKQCVSCDVWSWNSMWMLESRLEATVTVWDSTMWIHDMIMRSACSSTNHDRIIASSWSHVVVASMIEYCC